MPMTPEELKIYQARHEKVRRLRGRARSHPCAFCAHKGIDKAAHDWATVHETDGSNPWAHYVPLCKKCHFAYDGYGHHTPHSEETKALLSEKNTGYVHTPEAVEKIRAAALNPSPEARAKMAEAGRKSGATRRAAGPMPAEQRAKLSEALKGNTNAAGSNHGGKRSGQALENIRAGQQRRREREQAEREAREAGAA